MQLIVPVWSQADGSVQKVIYFVSTACGEEWRSSHLEGCKLLAHLHVWTLKGAQSHFQPLRWSFLCTLQFPAFSWTFSLLEVMPLMMSESSHSQVQFDWFFLAEECWLWRSEFWDDRWEEHCQLRFYQSTNSVKLRMLLPEQSFLGWSDIYIKCIIYSVWLIEVMDFALFGFGV